MAFLLVKYVFMSIFAINKNQLVNIYQQPNSKDYEKGIKIKDFRSNSFTRRITGICASTNECPDLL